MSSKCLLIALLGVGLVAASLLWWRRRCGIGRERAAREACLRASEEKFSTLFRANPLPLIITTVDEGRITDTNQAARSMLGYDLSYIVGKTVFDLGACPSPDVRANLFAQVEADGTARARELWFKAQSGRDLLLLTHANQILIDGRPFILTAFTDITELRHLEERLLSAQRMEVVGQLAGGIAHEFNNLLTVMQGHADALADALPQATGGPGRHVEAVRRSVMQAAQITAGLLTFARRTPVEAEPVDLNPGLRVLLPTLEGLIGQAIHLEADLESAPMIVEVDPAQIAQILINLTLNARDAMPGGGTLTIATRVAAGRDGVHPRADGCGSAELTVADTGVGMSEEVRRHIFEPFFTTKPPGRGTGLGLSVCYGIVEQMGGNIDVTSTEGQGTRVRVYLPLTSARPASLAAEPPTSISLVPQGQSILVVEDEPDVRDIVKEILENAGYTVRACDSLAAVRALLESDDPRIDLLLTDLVLPGGSGIEVAAAVSARHPSAPILFMSGYSESVYSQQTPVAHLLPKPFTSPALLRRVRELLEPRPP